MHWQVLIIPLIAFAVWILSNLLKEPELPPKERPRGEGDPFRPRRLPSDVDRFLAQQRQRRAEAERVREPVSQPVAQPERPARERPARDQPRPREERRPVQERETRPVSPPQSPAPTRPPVPVAVPVADRPTPTAAPPAPLAPLPDSGRNTPSTARAATTPALALPVNAALLPPLDQLLRSPQAARAAFILREIIDSPRCRRPRQPRA